MPLESAHQNSFLRRRTARWLALLAFILLILTWRLGGRGLNDPDEGRYAAMAQSMVDSGDWWEPRLSGYGHYDKPPLLYWVTATSLKLFGRNETAARLPSALAAVLTLIGIAWYTWRQYNERFAWRTTLILATCLQFIICARLLTPDMLLTAWTTLAIAAWAEARRFARETPFKNAGKSWAWWTVSALLWALGFWTKATPVFIPLIGLAIGLLITRDRVGWKSLRVFLLLPGILVLGCPWYLAMLHRFPELREFFFVRELQGRMTGHSDGRHGKFFYYIPISLVAWFPWWPLATWKWLTRKRLQWQLSFSAVPLEGWIVLTGLLILSFSASKLALYTLPLCPWVAVLMARAMGSRTTYVGSASDPSNEVSSVHFLSRPVAILALVSVLILLVGSTVIGDWEDRLKVNSSLRGVSSFLSTRGARMVYSDRYWPSLEFYLPSTVIKYFSSGGRHHPQERATDEPRPYNYFFHPKRGAVESPLPVETWAIHYRPDHRPGFQERFASRDVGQIFHFGDFDVWQLREK